MKTMTYAEWIGRMKAKGVVFLAFSCPKCGGEIETQRAPRGDTWDTLSTCPHCEALFMKITTHTKVEGLLPPWSSSAGTKQGEEVHP